MGAAPPLALVANVLVLVATPEDSGAVQKLLWVDLAVDAAD